MQWFPEVSPFEWFGHGAVEVGDEVQHFVPEVVSGRKVASSQQLPDQNTQPEFHQVNANAID